MAYREKFVSPGRYDSREEAERVLEKIREQHPSTSGWREIDAGVEQDENGKWYAYREHIKEELDRDDR